MYRPPEARRGLGVGSKAAFPARLGPSVTLLGARRVGLAVAVLVAAGSMAWAKPPVETKTQVMYFSTDMEVQLSKEYKERRMPFPVMRLGIIDSVKAPPPSPAPVDKSPKKRFAFIRIQVREGAGRSQVARQVVECARLAFLRIPGLEQADIDAVLSDDTAKTKADPWFAVSLKAEDFKTYSPKLVPEKWLMKTISALTISPKLKADRDPAQVTCDTFYNFYNEAYLRVPINRPPGAKAKTRKTGAPSGKPQSGKPDLPTQPD